MQKAQILSSNAARRLLAVAGMLFLSFSLAAQTVAPGPKPVSSPKNFDQAMDIAIDNENRLLQKLEEMQPLVETYIQEMRPDPDLGAVPKTDRYFLGRLDMSEGISHMSFIPAGTGFLSRSLGSFMSFGSAKFMPRGFAQMVVMDDGGFDRDHYNFEFRRREFLGGLRCLVYEVYPLKTAGHGRFIGRIWVEERGYNIVRFNGTYGPSTKTAHYSHFDSWRVNSGPHLWLPAYVYSEEAGLQPSPGSHLISFKAQTRLWGYQPQVERKQEEFTSIAIESPDSLSDHSEQAFDPSPIEAMRLWEHQAEENLIERLTSAGLIAPRGEVDKVLETVLRNLEITNKLEITPEVQARVLMTTPIEATTVGHTIVISRGLLDVLPNEASLGAMIAHQLAHIALGHSLSTGYAFSDRVMFDDEQTLAQVRLARTEEEEVAADEKAMEILKNSPYKDDLPKAGLFLKALASRSADLPSLNRPLLGNGLIGQTDLRMAALASMAPELEENRIDQIAAMPLGSRVKVDPWNNRLALIPPRNVKPLSPREKVPFEVTPISLQLALEQQGDNSAQPQNSGQTTTSATRLPERAQ